MVNRQSTKYFWLFWQSAEIYLKNDGTSIKIRYEFIEKRIKYYKKSMILETYIACFKPKINISNENFLKSWS